MGSLSHLVVHIWPWFNNMYPKWNPGKWTLGLTTTCGFAGFLLTHTHLKSFLGRFFSRVIPEKPSDQRTASPPKMLRGLQEVQELIGLQVLLFLHSSREKRTHWRLCFVPEKWGDLSCVCVLARFFVVVLLVILDRVSLSEGKAVSRRRRVCGMGSPKPTATTN